LVAVIPDLRQPLRFVCPSFSRWNTCFMPTLITSEGNTPASAWEGTNFSAALLVGEKRRFRRQKLGPSLGAPGFNVSAKTHNGTIVNGWTAESHCAPDYRYFCHGHTLATYENEGYSIHSGADMAAVLRDEWRALGRPEDINFSMPTIAIFYDNDRSPVHSARVKARRGTDLTVTSKNGPGELVECGLEELQHYGYPNTQVVFYESLLNCHDMKYLRCLRTEPLTDRNRVVPLLTKILLGP
jgi:hypothetical protein